MPRRCVAGGCSNTTADGFRLFKWPNDEKVARNWTKFVKNTRVWNGPTSWSLLCSAHFEDSCFDEICSVARDMGYKAKLKPSAVPSIKTLSATGRSNNNENRIISPSGIEGTSSPTDDWHALRTTGDCARETAAYAMLELAESYYDSFAGDFHWTDEQTLERNDESLPKAEPNRSAVKKRNRLRVLHEIELEQAQLSHKATQHCSSNRPTASVDLKKPYKRTRGTQMKPTTDTKSIQCNLLLPPEPHVEDLSDSDTDGDDELDAAFIPSAEEYDSEDSLISQSESPQAREENNRYFLVSESSLLKLFDTCPSCHSECERKVELVVGSHVRVRQKCSACTYSSQWSSQPFLNDTPAGNLLLSSAMLFCGAAISKILRFLDHLGMPRISYQTFLNHQNRYLQPAISSVWEAEQKKVIDSIRTSGGNLRAVGDGRADSPGHSAKYGTYTVMSTSLNKIVHMEVVAVTEVSSSNAMEREGLIRVIKHIEEKNLSVTELTTDRQPIDVKAIGLSDSGSEEFLSDFKTIA